MSPLQCLRRATTYFKPASGLPPHIVIFAHLKSLDVRIQEMPRKMEELFDMRSMAGPLSLDQIARAVENGPRMSLMASDIAALRRMVQDNNPSVEGGGAGTGVLVNQQPFARLHVQYRHGDGKERRVPPSWSMPKISLLGMYQYTGTLVMQQTIYLQ